MYLNMQQCAKAALRGVMPEENYNLLTEQVLADFQCRGIKQMKPASPIWNEEVLRDGANVIIAKKHKLAMRWKSVMSLLTLAHYHTHIYLLLHVNVIPSL